MLKTLSYFTPNYVSELKLLIRRENLYLLLWLSLMHYALGYQFKLIYVFSSLTLNTSTLPRGCVVSQPFIALPHLAE